MSIGVVYVHGFLSTGLSRKAIALRERLTNKTKKTTTTTTTTTAATADADADVDVACVIAPDLWQTREEFEQSTVGGLFPTISRAIEEAAGPAATAPVVPRRAVVLVGSSFGGLVALRFLQTR
jgi:predicted esterase YcpF (UPF0227 family)